MIGHIYRLPNTNITFEIIDKWFHRRLSLRIYEVEYTNPDIKYQGKGLITQVTFDKLELIK